MGVIFFFSSRPDLPSNNVDVIDFIIKKSAHFTEFFILTLLSYRSAKNLQAAVLFSLFYAFSDETHQLFVPGRGGKLTDVAIDAFGISTAFLVINFRLWKPLLLILKKRHTI